VIRTLQQLICNFLEKDFEQIESRKEEQF